MICAHLAVAESILPGFQVFGLNDALPGGWGGIGSFMRAGVPRGGIGAALFAATLFVTLSAARAPDLTTLNAAIRADTAPGLGFDNHCGFRD